MQILVNASNLKVGGGLQVADSLCCNLDRYAEHRFVVVLSSALRNTRKKIETCAHVVTYEYDVKNNLPTLVLGRDRFLDDLVKKHQIDAVLTVFGPSRWNPRCLHVSGFAMSHLLLQAESPYFRRMPPLERARNYLRNRILTYYFRRSTRLFYTENPYISQKLERLIRGSRVHTVSNYYNQVYDRPSAWVAKPLPSFDGVTLLTVTAPYPHKNLAIAVDVARILREQHPQFRFRFVMTIDREGLEIPQSLAEHFLLIGKVDIAECPALYRQSDVMFQPTLLECFTATYPEAMKMGCPIVTTDLEFARGLCGVAALYYEPLSAQSAADAVWRLVGDAALRKTLVERGASQLAQFDNYDARTDKLVAIMENEFNHTKI